MVPDVAAFKRAEKSRTADYNGVKYEILEVQLCGL
jgi:hypothetical protein